VTITEAVSEVDWSKGTIKPGRYQDFTVAFTVLTVRQTPGGKDHTGPAPLVTTTDRF
jgi:hypothetical protein